MQHGAHEQQRSLDRPRLGHSRGGSDRLPDWLHLVALAIAALAAALVYPLSARAGTASVQAGAAAPDFALKDLEGRNQRLSEFRGDVVVLTFWAGWCGECRTLLGEFATGLPAAADGGGPVLIGVSLDRDPQRARAMAASLGLGFPTLVDSEARVARLYDVSRLPLTLVLDREGVVREVHQRGAVDAALRARIAEELSRP